MTFLLVNSNHCLADFHSKLVPIYLPYQQSSSRQRQPSTWIAGMQNYQPIWLSFLKLKLPNDLISFVTVDNAGKYCQSDDCRRTLIELPLRKCYCIDLCNVHSNIIIKMVWNLRHTSKNPPMRLEVCFKSVMFLQQSLHSCHWISIIFHTEKLLFLTNPSFLLFNLQKIIYKPL